jgi:type 1 fimbriae regulatory protein FimB
MNMGQIKYLSREQQGKLLKTVKQSKHATNTRDLLYFTLCLRYGLRASEARNMELSHVKLDQNSVYIQRIKGGVSQFYPIREDDKKLIKKWLKHRDQLKYSDSPFLFITKRSKQMSRLLPIKLFEKYAKIAGIEGHGCHSLRHSTAVNLLDQEVDLFDIKTWLGHSSINSTMQYLKIGTSKTRERMRNVLESM